MVGKRIASYYKNKGFMGNHNNNTWKIDMTYYHNSDCSTYNVHMELKTITYTENIYTISLLYLFPHLREAFQIRYILYNH